MNLKILLPFQVFMDKSGVQKLLIQTPVGSLGILPHRLDCVAAVLPGLLIFETLQDGEVCVAVDEGVLVKTGKEVHVSVRNAIGGTDLNLLQEKVDAEFLNLTEAEQIARSAIIKMESSFIQRLMEFQHE